KKVDSLEQLLKRSTREDTTRIKLLDKLSFLYSDIDPDKGLLYANKVIELSKKIGDKENLSVGFYNRGINYSSLGKDSLAINALNTAITYARANKDKSNLGNYLNGLAILLINRGEYRKSLDLRFEVLDIYTELNDIKKIGRINGNIGVNYYFLSDFPHALKYYLKSLQIAEERGDKVAMASWILNIGIVLKKMNQYDKAFKYYERALKIYKELNDTQGVIGVLSSLGTAYDEVKQPTKAIEYYNKALTLSKEIKYKLGVVNNLADIGVVYSGIRSYSKAIAYLKASLKANDDRMNSNILSMVYSELGSILLEASDKDLKNAGIDPLNKLSIAEKYVLSSIENSKASGQVEREMLALNILSQVQERQKNPAIALSTFKRYAELKDSILNDEKKAAITEQEQLYESNKKDLLNDAAIQREKEIKKYTIAGSLMVIVTLFLLFMIYRSRKDAKQKHLELLHKAQLSENEMKVLRLQMNPHFIFNSLNSISDYINKNDPQTADYYLSK
ncbi:MAG: tetratricopeptide repeat protein, partial [Flavobacterium sp.]